jgi:flagellar basal-body rod modification protein FlgD
MIVSSPTTQTAAARASASDAQKSSVDYDSFLKLLIATMQNQDPTKPNDPSETLSQLASFSTVEQNIKINEKLESLLAVSGMGQAAALVGKQVSNLDDSARGRAASVEMTPSGLTVILDDGKRLPVADGIRIS